MLNYTINNNNSKTEIKNYYLVSAHENTEYNFFEFYTREPHLLTDQATININNNKNLVVSLRKQIKVGINAKKLLKWRFIDNSNDWKPLTEVTTSSRTQLIYKSDLTNEENGFSTYYIDYQISTDGIIQIKEHNSLVWQDFMLQDEINPNQEVFSEESNIRAMVVLDTYFRINSFDRYIPIPIIEQGYNDVIPKSLQTYLFKTNYQPILTEDDIIVVTLEDVEDETAMPEDFVNEGGLWITPLDETYIDPNIIHYYNVIVNSSEICEPDEYNFNIITINSDVPIDIQNIIKEHPEHINSVYKVLDFFDFNIWKEIALLNLKLNLNSDFSTKTLQNDLIEKDFFEIEREKAINPIVDTERIQYEPYYFNDKKPIKINKIIFNFHFKDPNNSDIYMVPTHWDFLGFVNEDVKYQKSRLKQTFIRLSYYDTQNPSEQLLEYYNVIFTNINSMYNSYIKNEKAIISDPLTDGRQFDVQFSVYNPLVKEDNDILLSGSSEGYYIYLFNQEKPKNKPQSIYMKVEFNSSLSGKRYLFFNRDSDTESEYKGKGGCPLNNIFFDANKKLNFVYIKLNIVYNPELDKYIYYIDEEYLKYLGSNITQENDVLTINFYEAKVQ